MTWCTHDVTLTCTGERCDVTIDDIFVSDNVTTDVIDRDDSFEPNGNMIVSVTVEQKHELDKNKKI